MSIITKIKDYIKSFNGDDLIKNNWTVAELQTLYDTPFLDLLFAANFITRQNFNPNEIDASILLSIKTGSCPEDCKYCPQSAHFKNPDLEKEDFLDVSVVLENAKNAKKNGAKRFCMGAAWRNLNNRDLEKLGVMVKDVKNLGLETCLTVGMLNQEQVDFLDKAGLDYYNHNIDSSEEYYKKIITTRSYQDRLDTLERVKNSNIKVCSGGILGMGEEVIDRIKMVQTLANLDKHPESVPLNLFIRTAASPLKDVPQISNIDFVRIVALARITMPKSWVRLSAGRNSLSTETQALCFFAGANSVFLGDKLLTADNIKPTDDAALFKLLNLNIRPDA